MQSALGITDLGQFYHKPLRDSHGTVVLSCILNVKVLTSFAQNQIYLLFYVKPHMTTFLSGYENISTSKISFPESKNIHAQLPMGSP